MVVDINTGRKDKPKYIWAGVCKSWGIHMVATSRQEIEEENRNDRKAGCKKPWWCGPHKPVKLVLSRK